MSMENSYERLDENLFSCSSILQSSVLIHETTPLTGEATSWFSQTTVLIKEYELTLDVFLLWVYTLSLVRISILLAMGGETIFTICWDDQDSADIST